MNQKLEPIEPIPMTPERRIDLSQTTRRVQRPAASQTFQHSPATPVAPAQYHVLPATLLQLEPQPLSAYDDNPVFEPASAARFIGVSTDCLKKWRQRNQGPDYIQYGPNGVVRYELNALKEFRDTYKVRTRRKN